MLTTLIVIIGLSVLIIGHEAGHFIAAKLFRLRVDEFGFGFPPRMFAKKKGETEYSFNWLPFGGFVKIAGENDQFDAQSEAITPEVRNRFFFVQPAWRKSVVILAGVFVNFVIGWLLLSTVLAMGIPKALIVTNVTPGSLAAQAGFLENDIIKEHRDVSAFLSFLNGSSEAKSIEVIRQTKGATLAIAGAEPIRSMENVILVTKVQENSPADQAGIKPGDVIKNFPTAQEFISYIRENRGEQIELTILRGEEELVVKPTVREDTSKGGIGVFLGTGTLTNQGLLLEETGAEGQNIFLALWHGLKQTGMLSWYTLTGFYDLAKNLISTGSISEGVVGPVGIFSFAHQASSIGIASLLYLIAVISINLAVINLVPFPALDGGRFFMIIIEKIKGSPLSRKIEGVVNTVGFALLIILMLVITARDIINL